MGEPITDEMRVRAKEAYLVKKRAEHEKILELAAAAKRKREEQQRSRPVYPWGAGVASCLPRLPGATSIRRAPFMRG